MSDQFRSWAKGHSLEQLLNHTHNMYLAQGKAWVQHNGIAGTWHSGGKGKPVFAPISREAAPDYYGCVGGKFVAFDAKSTTNKKYWRLHKKDGHQFDRLRTISQHGGVAFFLVEFLEVHEVRMLRIAPDSPWPKVFLTNKENRETGHGANFLSVLQDRNGLYNWLPWYLMGWSGLEPDSYTKPEDTRPDDL